MIAELQRYLRHHASVDRDQLVALVRRTESEISQDASAAGPDDSGALDVTARGQIIHAKTDGQKRYLNAIAHHDLVFCEGPAGTGKTFLAVAMAVSLLRRSILRRIVLVRPAVEAGEKLGFLPGGIEEKVNPYLRPLLDALSDMMTFEQIRRYMANDIIEVAPSIYAVSIGSIEAVIILDEAQNTTPAQMLMFLTRLGEKSKMIVTGDPSQVDLERGQQSGLTDAHHTLRGIKGIAHIKLDKADIVRHRLVQNIVQAYADRNRRRRADLTAIPNPPPPLIPYLIPSHVRRRRLARCWPPPARWHPRAANPPRSFCPHVASPAGRKTCAPADH